MAVYILTSVLAWFYMLVFLFFAWAMVFRTPPKEDGQFTAGNIMTFMSLVTSVVLFMNLK